MYDWRGRFIEWDDEEPTLRRHCTRCGSFLPSKPQEVQRSIPSRWETTWDNEGNIASMTILEEEIEQDYKLICARCGHQHEDDDMWV